MPPSSAGFTGASIAIPRDPGDLEYEEVDLRKIRAAYLRGRLKKVGATGPADLTTSEVSYLAAEIGLSDAECTSLLGETISAISP